MVRSSFVVLGMGRSGQSAAAWLKEQGNDVICVDDTLSQGHNIDWLTVKAVVVSPGIPFSFPQAHPIVSAAHSHNVPILTDINLLQQAMPKKHYVGITGTNGKSTTTSLIGHIFKSARLKTGVGGNIGIPALSLLNQSIDHFVLELSSYQLERSQAITLDTAVWTNISEDHLDKHGTMEAYVSAKERIFEKAATGVIAIDDPYSRRVYEKHSLKLMSVSEKDPSATLTIEKSMLYYEGRLVVDLSSLQRLQGRHNYQNAALAYGTACQTGIDEAIIVEALFTFPGLAHRQEIVRKIGNVTFVNDSKATNAEATQRALETYMKRVPILWIAGGRAKTQGIETLRAYFPQILHTFLMGEAQQAFSETLNGFSHTCCDTLEKAIEKAYDMSKHIKEDVLILLSPACASFDQFKDFEQRGDYFKECVKNL